MSSLKDILSALQAAVRAGELAGDCIADHSGDPFARILLQQTRLATARHRESRDMLKAAIIASKKKKQNSLPNPLTTCRDSEKDRT
jgi:hypothetical protein